MSCEGKARGWEVLLSLTTFEFGADQRGRHQCLDGHKPCHGLSCPRVSRGGGPHLATSSCTEEDLGFRVLRRILKIKSKFRFPGSKEIQEF